jgi:hypothetical protein
MAVWRRDQIWFDLDPDGTGDPTATVAIDTPIGRIEVMADVGQREAEMVLRGMHIGGAPAFVNRMGAANLRLLAQVFMELIYVRSLVVTGGVRTTGANPGRTPGPRRFTRDPAD